MKNNIRHTTTSDGRRIHTLQVGGKTYVLGLVAEAGHCANNNHSRIIR